MNNMIEDFIHQALKNNNTYIDNNFYVYFVSDVNKGFNIFINRMNPDKDVYDTISDTYEIKDLSIPYRLLKDRSPLTVRNMCIPNIRIFFDHEQRKGLAFLGRQTKITFENCVFTVWDKDQDACHYRTYKNCVFEGV